ncbi:response regulator transcription factor [Paenibacillus senegalensis]|uniref:response regulator transcription factor n=1 Tax=Paenibacillus senegalensis TaxID=1465766 RepID=UPI000289B4F4|nr:response regulator [Paenibacillus senegalensis]
MTDANVMQVVLVDDELPLRQELRLFPWREHGFELAGEAENGEMALQLCRKIKPQIVITDITMPVMNGLDLLRTLKDEQLNVKVILLTCHSDFEFAREALRFGAVEYLLKVTMESEELVNALNHARTAYLRERMLEANKQAANLKADSLYGDKDKHSDIPAAVRKEIADAIDYIRENLQHSLSLNVVAEQVNLSPHYFSRLFREETGISYQSYITTKRMEKAAYLLRTTSLRVYEVAYEVGIPSYRYFASMFREYAGIPPTEYKKSGLFVSAAPKG